MNNRNIWYIVAPVLVIIVLAWLFYPRTAQTPTAPSPDTSTAPSLGPGAPDTPHPAPQQ